MQKRLLVIAAGVLQEPIIIRAREMGHYVIAADGDEHAHGFQYADKAIVTDITNEEEMVKIAIQEKVDGVIHPCSEVAMNVMGRIHNELGLPGVSKEQALKATNKQLMREAFEKEGAPNPKSLCFKDSELAWNSFCKEFKGDCIIKPSRNSGSRGVSKIYRDITHEIFTELFEKARQESRDKSVMLEQFIEGPEFSVEIIVSKGKIHVLAVTDKKTTGAPHFVELGHSQPSCFPKETVDTIRKAAIKGVKALGVDNCACHAEVKIQNKKAYLMEIGARMGGDFISTVLTRLSTGVDMVEAAINCALGIELDLKPKARPQGACIRYFCPIPGKLVSISNTESLEDPRVISQIYVKPGDVIPEVTSSLSRSGHVIVTAKTAQDAIDRADQIVSEIKFKTE